MGAHVWGQPEVDVPTGRVAISELDGAGAVGPVDLIARSLGLVSRTVRQLSQRLRVQGKNALATSYPSRAYPHPPQFRALIEEALQLRRAHPTWGAGLVRVLLRRHYPADPIPAER